MTKKPKMVRVRITARQVTRFDQVVEMTDGEWQELDALMQKADSNREAERLLIGEAEGWLDLGNCTDWDELEDVEVALAKPAKEVKRTPTPGEGST